MQFELCNMKNVFAVCRRVGEHVSSITDIWERFTQNDLKEAAHSDQLHISRCQQEDFFFE